MFSYPHPFLTVKQGLEHFLWEREQGNLDAIQAIPRYTEKPGESRAGRFKSLHLPLSPFCPAPPHPSSPSAASPAPTSPRRLPAAFPRPRPPRDGSQRAARQLLPARPGATPTSPGRSAYPGGGKAAVSPPLRGGSSPLPGGTMAAGLPQAKPPPGPPLAAGPLPPFLPSPAPSSPRGAPAPPPPAPPPPGSQRPSRRRRLRTCRRARPAGRRGLRAAAGWRRGDT